MNPSYGSATTALLMLCGLAGACAPIIYTPPPHQTPLLESAGDTRTNILVGTGLQGGAGFDLAVQAAHAPLPHVFVHGTALQSLRSDQLQSFAEVGLGAWAPPRHGLTLEVLGGYGRGYSDAESLDPHWPLESATEMQGTFERAYVQVNFARARTFTPAYVPAPVPGHLGLAFRFSHVWSRDFAWNLPDNPEALRGTYFEPAVFVRMGDDPFQFEARLGLSQPLHQSSYDYGWQILYGSLGVSVDIGRLLRR